MLRIFAIGHRFLLPLATCLVLAWCGCSPGQTASEEGKEILEFPPPDTETGMPLVEALKLRRSVRSFESGELTLEQLGQLCWAAQGITKESSGFRTAPSAGATYPLEIYFLLPGGVYHYIPQKHVAERVKTGDARKALQSEALGQRWVGQGAAVFVIAADYSRTSGKYGARAARYVVLEAGHAVQNILLQAVALGLGGCPVGAFDDNGVSNVVRLADGLEPLYIIPVGVRAK
jgi:SagB-type dehydrogenase family enzyme